MYWKIANCTVVYLICMMSIACGDNFNNDIDENKHTCPMGLLEDCNAAIIYGQNRFNRDYTQILNDSNVHESTKEKINNLQRIILVRNKYLVQIKNDHDEIHDALNVLKDDLLRYVSEPKNIENYFNHEINSTLDVKYGDTCQYQYLRLHGLIMVEKALGMNAKDLSM